MKHMDHVRACSVLRPQQRGFTLTEATLVLGIAGLILGAIWAAASAVYQSNHNKLMTADLLTVINGWKSVFGSRQVDLGAYPTDITQQTVNNSFVLSDMVPPPGTAGGCVIGGAAVPCFINVPGTPVQLNVQSDQANNAIGVQFTNLSTGECVYLGNSVSNTPGLLKMNINTNTASFPPLGTAAQLSGGTVTAQCNNVGNANSMLVEFVMQ